MASLCRFDSSMLPRQCLEHSSISAWLPLAWRLERQPAAESIQV